MITGSIDLSNPCNLNCPYCFIEEKDSTRKVRKPDELTLAETYEVIDVFTEMGASSITIVGAGEPTIDPHFREIIKYIHEHNMISVVFTNGITISNDLDLVKFLYEMNVSVVLKVNSFDETVQDIVAGRKGYSQKRDIALERLLDYGFNSHHPTRLGFDLMAFSSNYGSIPEVYEFARTRNIYPIIGDYIPTGRTDMGKFKGAATQTDFDSQNIHLEQMLAPLTDSEQRSLYGQLREIDSRIGITHHDHSAYFSGGVCIQRVGLYVDISGDIWPCVARKIQVGGEMVERPLGNIREGADIKEIWESNLFINRLLSEYDGSCPYKRPISAK